MAEMADEIFVAHATPNGNIDKLIKRNLSAQKIISTFDLEENSFLIKEGVIKYTV